MNDAAEHKAEASDHIGDCVFQTKRHRKTSDAECGEQGGRVDSKHRLQQRADGECPYHHTQDVDEDGGIRHLRFVKDAAHYFGECFVDERCDDKHYGEQNELAVVSGKPLCEKFNWIHGCLVYTWDIARNL